MSAGRIGTEGAPEVGVETEVRYLEEHSDLEAPRHAFAYTITLHNRSEETVQLLRRHWIITDGDGDIQEVEGEGVVGLQPEIDPGQRFRYTSGTLLATAVGSMEGNYLMHSQTAGEFRVAIPSFALILPGMLN